MNSEFLALFGALPPVSPKVCHTMTKAVFFDAVHTWFGSNGNWRSCQNTGKTRAMRGNENGPTHGSDHTGISFLDQASEYEKARSVNIWLC